MYDKQVKLFRYCAETNCNECAVAGCPGPQKFLKEAADAIEARDKAAKEWEILAESWRKACKGLESKMPHWIPMTERPPEEKLCFYSCYTDKGIVVECLWTNNRYGLGPFGEWGWRLMDVPQHQHVTHWMPLPEPPKENGEQNDG